MTAARAEDLGERIYQELLTRNGEERPEPRLHATRWALELLGEPHRRYPIVHVTGTNGKTSTSRIAESVLRAHGLRTGLFTSPHLQHFGERILIDGSPVTDQVLGAAWERVAPALHAVDRRLTESGEQRLTFFEAMTVLAFEAIAGAQVDAAVIEVGMGGAWDSTNVADGRVAVITPISLDHTRELGSTIAEIAATKAGIIKPGARVVLARQEPSAAAAVELAARQRGAELLQEGEQFAVLGSAPEAGGQRVTVRTANGGRLDLRVPLLGRHQAQNTAVAVVAVDALFDGERALVPDRVAQGVASARSPGRLEALDERPPLFVDAAHNPAGAEALVGALDEWLPDREIGMVVGVLEEKDAEGIVSTLARSARTMFITRSASPRAIGSGALLERVTDAAPGVPVSGHARLEDAVRAARGWADAGANRAVVVTGSITLVGEMLAGHREWWREPSSPARRQDSGDAKVSQ